MVARFAAVTAMAWIGLHDPERPHGQMVESEIYLVLALVEHPDRGIVVIADSNSAEIDGSHGVLTSTEDDASHGMDR